MKINQKLFLTFAALLAVIAVANSLIYYGIGSSSAAHEAKSQSLLQTIQIEKMRAALYRQQNAVGNTLATGEERFSKTYATAKAAFLQAGDKFMEMSPTQEQNSGVLLTREIVNKWWADAGDAMITLGRDPATHAAALQLVKQFPLGKAYDAIDEVEKLQGERVLAMQAEAERGESAMRKVLAISFALVVLVAVAMGVVLSRSIAKPVVRLTGAMRRLATGDNATEVPFLARKDEVGEMAEALQTFKAAALEKLAIEEEAHVARQAKKTQDERQIALDGAKAEDLLAFVHAVEHGFNALAEGDLTIRMHQAVAPEFEPIRAKFNISVEKLEDAIGGVIGGVSTLRTGLSEISVASNDLAHRTEQQAASLEETVAALSEVTRGVNQTAEGAARAQVGALSAQKKAEKGGEIVGSAVEAMSQIEQSSDKIGKIIGVIDEIAFQTNLLALNAGVEAARAGEAGRGFAVVAQEVRGLAQRSAEAAKEIKELISTSSAQVERGVALVTASGKSLGEIVSEVADMSSVVAEIARSAKEQAVSLREVSAAADQMDKVTQQNAAMVEEATAAAQTLSNETDDLAAMVERFRTATGQVARGRGHAQSSAGFIQSRAA